MPNYPGAFVGHVVTQRSVIERVVSVDSEGRESVTHVQRYVSFVWDGRAWSKYNRPDRE